MTIHLAGSLVCEPNQATSRKLQALESRVGGTTDCHTALLYRCPIQLVMSAYNLLECLNHHQQIFNITTMSITSGSAGTISHWLCLCRRPGAIPQANWESQQADLSNEHRAPYWGVVCTMHIQGTWIRSDMCCCIEQCRCCTKV